MNEKELIQLLRSILLILIVSAILANRIEISRIQSQLKTATVSTTCKPINIIRATSTLENKKALHTIDSLIDTYMQRINYLENKYPDDSLVKIERRRLEWLIDERNKIQRGRP